MTALTDLSISPLTNFSNSQLADKYNEAAKMLGVESIKRFRDKQTAVRCTAEILAKIERTIKPRAKRGMRFVFPFHGSEHLRSMRDLKTLRGRCVPLLKIGAAFSEIEALVEAFDQDRGRPSKNVERRAYELVRIMHYYLGYGIDHDPVTGVIKLHTREVGG